jgi:cysteine-rich repeat protein
VQAGYGELCDQGANDGAYGGCATDCRFGPRCGDGVVQPAYEQCDDGANDGAYGGCGPGCKLGPHCGDGTIAVSINPATGKPFEECDDGNAVVRDGCSYCRLDR